MANRNKVQIRVVGNVASSALAKPRESKKSNKPQYYIGLHNISFQDNDLQNPQVIDAIQKLQIRIRKPTNEYPDPTLFISLPLYNQDSDKQNYIKFYDAKTTNEVTLEHEPEIGEQVEVYVDTYDSESGLTDKYGHRTARITYIVFPDFSKVRWFVPSNEGLAGFTSLEDQGKSGVRPTYTQAPAEPQFNSSTPQTDPFTQQQAAAPTATAAPNRFTQPSQVPLAETNPLLSGKSAVNNGFTPNNNQAAPQANGFTPNSQAAPQGNGFTPNGQAAPQANGFTPNSQAAPQGNGFTPNGQAAPQANGFTPNGQAAPQGNGFTPNSQAAPQGNGFPPNSQAAPQGNGFTPNSQAAPQTNGQTASQAPKDPFSNTGDTVDLTDEDLPF